MLDYNRVFNLAAGIILGTTLGIAQIPVSSCGTELKTPGALYVMTADLFCSFSPGVKITASNIIFDLGGHKLQGPGEGSGIITAQGATCVWTTGVQIRNGQVINWRSGIDLCAPPAPVAATTNTSVLNMNITGNIGGIRLFNVADNTLRDSSITANNLPDPTANPVFSGQGCGIYLSNSSETKIKNNQVSANPNVGIFVDPGSDDNTIRDNTINKNGLYGIALLEGSTSNGVKKNVADRKSVV